MNKIKIFNSDDELETFVNLHKVIHFFSDRKVLYYDPPVETSDPVIASYTEGKKTVKRFRSGKQEVIEDKKPLKTKNV